MRSSSSMSTDVFPKTNINTSMGSQPQPNKSQSGEETAEDRRVYKSVHMIFSSLILYEQSGLFVK